MKLPVPKGIIEVYGAQDRARAAEGVTMSDSRNVYNLHKGKDKEGMQTLIEETKELPQAQQQVKETKKVHLLEGNPNK